LGCNITCGSGKLMTHQSQRLRSNIKLKCENYDRVIIMTAVIYMQSLFVVPVADRSHLLVAAVSKPCGAFRLLSEDSGTLSAAK
jgi:hypothetical protein